MILPFLLMHSLNSFFSSIKYSNSANTNLLIMFWSIVFNLAKNVACLSTHRPYTLCAIYNFTPFSIVVFISLCIFYFFPFCLLLPYFSLLLLHSTVSSFFSHFFFRSCIKWLRFIFYSHMCCFRMFVFVVCYICICMSPFTINRIESILCIWSFFPHYMKNEDKWLYKFYNQQK